MSDPFLAEIRIFPFNFAPVGWMMCNGQILSVGQFSALFSLIGTYYGGNGTSNFGLPNLQGCVPLGAGQGGGLSPYSVGENGGAQTVTLQTAMMPSHNHLLAGDAEPATSASPANALFMAGHYTGPSEGKIASYSNAAPDTGMSQSAFSPAGNNLPHNNMMPYLTLNFCIALVGTFPSRG